MLSDWRAQLWAGEDAVLIPAKFFVNGTDIYRRDGGTVWYNHVMFDRHQVIFAEGIEAESFHPGEAGMSSLERDVRNELFAMFPELERDVALYGACAFPDLRGREALALLAA